MDLQLQESSIRNLLLKGGELKAVGKVRSESLFEEMSLIGFIPYTVYYEYKLLSLKADFNDQLIVSPYFVKFSKQDSVLPIFKSVVVANDKRYKIDEKFQLDAIPESVLDKLSTYTYKNYASYFKPPMSGNTLLELRNKRLKAAFDKLFENYIEIIPNAFDADLGIQYIAQSDNLELSGNITGITMITNDFLCLCCYMNKVTGMPSYTILQPDDIIRVLPDDEH